MTEIANKNSVMIHIAVFTQYRSVMDRHTDKQKS